MAEQPIFLADNYYDDLLNTDHSIAANEEATGFEAWHVANARRSPDDYWTPTTENQAATLDVDAGASKAADMIAIDRGHNLEGQTVTLQTDTTSAFSSPTTVFSATIPSSSSASSDIDATNGAYTEEGAWVKRFTSTSSQHWRVQVAAAASYKPIIVGLSLGEAWTPGVYPEGPFDEDASAGVWASASNDQGWSAYSSIASPREGALDLRIASFDDADARAFQTIYRTGKPVWFVPDPAKAERAMVIKAPPNARIEAPVGEPGWSYRTVRLPYIEHEPEIG